MAFCRKIFTVFFCRKKKVLHITEANLIGKLRSEAARKSLKMQPKTEFTTKHRIFGAIKHASQESFTQPLVVMVEPFRRWIFRFSY